MGHTCATYILSTCGLVAMTSASHAEGRQFDPGQVYVLNCVQLQRWRLRRRHAFSEASIGFLRCGVRCVMRVRGALRVRCALCAARGCDFGAQRSTLSNEKFRLENEIFM